MKKIKLFKIIGIIIIINLFIISIFLIVTENIYFSPLNHTGNPHFSYDIQIISIHSDEYIVYVPIAETITNDSSQVIQHLELIQGTASYSLIDTQYGNMLKIEGIGNITIKSTDNKHFSFHLSTREWNETSQKWSDSCWVYYNSSNSKGITIDIKVMDENKMGGGHINETYPPKQKINLGWQKITIESDAWDV